LNTKKKNSPFPHSVFCYPSVYPFSLQIQVSVPVSHIIANSPTAATYMQAQLSEHASNMQHGMPIVTYNGNQYCVITRAPDLDVEAMQKPLDYGHAAGGATNIIVMSPMQLLPPQQQQQQPQQQQQQQ